MEGIDGTSCTRIAVVTGSNKGIGLEICRQLALNGIYVVLTARDQKRGSKAAKKFQESGLFNVVFHQLDVTNTISIVSLAKFIETSYGKLDILINNAGVAGGVLDWSAMKALNLPPAPLTDETENLLMEAVEQTYEMVEECLETNFYGTKRVTAALIPLLQLSQSPRIVNVSSSFGQLKFINNEKVKEHLENIESLTVEKLDDIVEWYLRDFREGKLKENGWPLFLSAYKVSKALVNAYTRLIAKEFTGFRVNCVDPGYVRSGMNSMGDMTPEEGARGPVMLALRPDTGASGLYYNQTEPCSF